MMMMVVMMIINDDDDQVLAGVIANLPGLSAGLSMGFSAILIPQLAAPGAEITASLEQGSWIASLFVIGDLLGCVIGGPIADRSVKTVLWTA